jgi:hypothetical protein
MGNSAHYDVLLEDEKTRPQTTQYLAADTLSILYAANANDEKLYQRLQDVVRETGWYESLAETVVRQLEKALEEKAPMGQAMKVAYEMAAQAAKDVLQFAKDHPVFCALVALGILVVLMPWLIEVLGFGELGPIEGICQSLCTCASQSSCVVLLVGTFAAFWQSRYGGYVPKKSLFAFFQRLGMVWKMKP